MKKSKIYFIEKIKISIFALFLLWGYSVVHAQTSLEMFPKATTPTNPTGSGPVQSTKIYLQDNTDNPTGNTVAAANNPVDVTYTLSNHAYTYTTGNPLGTGFMTNIGAATNSGSPDLDGRSAIYPLMNSIANPANNFYTAGTATGQGIDVTANRNVNFHIYVQPLVNNSINPTSRIKVCNLTLTFSRPVDNPILHITGMGAYSQSTSGVTSSYSAEFNVLGGYTLTRLSGIDTTGFKVSGNQINNDNNSFFTSGVGSGSGSVRVDGTDISTLTLEVYIDGANSNTIWNPFGTADAGETVTIGVSVPQNVLVANNDTFSGGTVGTSVTTASVLANDTFNGGSATTTNVTVSGTTVPAGFTVNADGTITKAASVAPGTYTITYQICDNAEAGNCKSATATITVSCPALSAPTLSSTTASVTCPNTFNLNSLVTSSTPSGATLKWYTDTAHTTEVTTPTSITTGGTYYAFYTSGTCFSPASAAVTVTFHSPAAPTVSATTLTNVCPLRSVNLNSLITSTTPTGTTLVWYDKNNLGAGPLADPTNVTTSGTYVAKYNPTGTCNATDGPFWTPDVVVTITNCVDAIDGSQTVAAGSTGTISVLANDTYNGGAAGSATLSNVNLTQISTTNVGVTLNTSTGMIQVAAGTPAGTYTVTYQICTKTTPVTCDTATETVTVSNLLDAVNDTYASVTPGTSTTSVITNDKNVAGTAAVIGSAAGQVSIRTSTDATGTAGSWPSGITLNADGTIAVANGTAAGTYTLYYTICNQTAGTPCDTATVTLTVPPTIDAVNGSQTVSAGSTGTTSVIANDSIQGGAAGTVTLGASGNSTISQTGTTNSGVNIDANGNVVVNAGTPAGTYNITYQICTKATPVTCDTATETVTVPNLLDAVNDTYASVTPGTSTTSVITNDKNMAGTAAVIGTAAGQVSIRTSTDATGTAGSWPSGITLNADGTIAVANGTAAGTYTLYYTICNQTAGTPCDTATVTLTVPPTIDAVNGSQTVSAGSTGTTSVIANDSIQGGAAGTVTLGASGNSTISQTGTTNSGVNIDANGNVVVNAGTPAGTYTITYQICTKAIPVTCDTATETVTVGSLLDSDGDGIPDNIDIDDDNDGILDTVENSSCSVSSPVVYGSNLVTNGSFESGNTGFTSAFNYGTCNTTCGDAWEAAYGSYYLVASACNCSGSNSGVPAWQALPHSGNNLLIVDFPPSGTSNIYAQTINVKPNTKYNFSVWLINLITSGNFPDPSLQLSIQENTGTIVPIGTGANVPEGAGWVQTAYDFITGSTTSTVTIYIQNGNSGGSGNDAGIDDITLREVFCDTDGDGVPNSLDLDSDNDGCPDAIEGGANILASQLVNSGGTLQGGNGINPVVTPTSGTYNQAVLKNICASNTCVNAQGLPQFSPTVPTNYSNTTGQTGDIAYNSSIISNACKCFKTGATGGTVLDTNHGITVLGRAGADNGNWPMIRKGAWTALEAKSKGFVINRVHLTADLANITPAVEGMIVYDEEADCLKIYTKDDAPATTFSWRCFNTQTCPDIL